MGKNNKTLKSVINSKPGTIPGNPVLLFYIKKIHLRSYRNRGSAQRGSDHLQTIKKAPVFKGAGQTFGAVCRNRTDDLIITSDVLYQLS